MGQNISRFRSRRSFLAAGMATTSAAVLVGCDRQRSDPLAGVRGRVLRAGAAGYDVARKVWNQAYDRHPLAMVRCVDLDDVRRCVEFARRQSVPIAVRGGGHSYAGFGVADGALQIDLGQFNTVTVDRDRRTASVGGGTRIGDLLAGTLAVGLYTPMGSCGAVGVAGLTLAGGDTSGRGLFGTACDNLIGAQLVTADGEVRELGPGVNEDLFWAIRGGGGNFGVVTRLDFRLYPVRPAYTASFDLGWDDISDAMRAFGELMSEAPDEAGAGFTVVNPRGAVVDCSHRGDRAAAMAYLDRWRTRFRLIEPTLSISTPDPVGEVWHSLPLAVEGAFLEGLNDDLIEVLARAVTAGRGFGEMLMGLSHGAAARIAMTDTAYPLRGVGLSSLIYASWTTPATRKRAEAWIAETGAALRPWARRAYVNYLGPSAPERVREIYGRNYARLASIKGRYDPDNLFRSNQNILPGSQ